MTASATQSPGGRTGRRRSVMDNLCLGIDAQRRRRHPTGFPEALGESGSPPAVPPVRRRHIVRHWRRSHRPEWECRVSIPAPFAC
eukprot:gene16333-biopygen3762